MDVGLSSTLGDFCGDPIFNETLLLYSTWPHFTECFQNTLLVWVPCGWIWVTLLPYLAYLHSYGGRPLPSNRWNVGKTFLSLILGILSALQVLQLESKPSDGSEGTAKVYDAEYVGWAVKAATYLLTALLIQLERRKGLVTSGVLWVFWFASVLANIVPFYSDIIQQTYDTKMFSFVLFYVFYACLLTQLGLASFAEKMPRRGYSHIDDENPSPEQTSSFPSRIVYMWMNKLVFLGYRRPLKQEDVFSLHPRDKGATVIPQFEKAWNKELAKARLKQRHESQQEKYTNGVASFSSPRKRQGSSGEANERTPMMKQQRHRGASYSEATPDVEIKEGRKPKVLQASLFKILAKTYGLDLLESHLCKLVYDLLQFVSPILLNELITYTKNLNKEVASGYGWKGYVLASSFFVVASFGSVMFQQNFHLGMSNGMRVRSALIAAIYKKSLTISNEAKKTSTVGEIVNLMSVDCQRMQDVAGYLWMLWSAPLQIGLAMYMLWNVLGVATLAGLAIMVLLMPLNAVIATFSRKLQIQQMKFKDERIKLMSEVLNGMKVLKLYAWEPAFEDKVNAIRNQELTVLKKAAYLNAISTFTWTCAPFLVTLGTFATYVLVSDSHYLDANKAFVALSLFNILRFPINILPMMVTFVVQASVSIGRISRFLRQEDLKNDNVIYDKQSESAVRIRDGKFTWDRSNPTPTLSNININVSPGQLIAVVGQVGAGKSSLVSAMLGEMEKLQGEVVVQSSIAYVPQQAWIQNATLKDNILFGAEMRNDKYTKIIDACALKSDLEILPGGDMTEIGEKGINLSGGQKQRVSLARAVYSNADIYLLDDPLSAVDSHVGKHIFDEVVSHKGCLKGKTRILVTHGIQWLPQVDSIVVMVDGKVSEAGSYDELLSHDGDFAQFLKTYLTQGDESEDDEEEDPEVAAIKMKMLERVDSVTSDCASSGDELLKSAGRSRKISRTISSNFARQKSVSVKEGKEEKKAKKVGEKLVEEETSETGKVHLSVFASYFRAIGVVSTAVFISFFAAYQGASVFSSIWLAQWTSDDLLRNTSLSNTSRYENKNYMYLGVYGGLGVVQALLILVYAIIASTQMVRAAGVLHSAMLTNIMHNAMSFFDTTPSGRILNRFSKDVDTVDNTLPSQLRSWMNTSFGTLSTLVVISYTTPIFMLVIIPLAVLYYLIQRFYVHTSRQLKRMESTTRSPIYSNFSETISGAVSIRAYKSVDRFISESEARVDKNLAFYFAGIASNRWLAVRLEFLGNLLVLSAAMFVVIMNNTNDSLVGLSISYALQITSSLNWMVRTTSDLETNIVAVERMKEYSELETEAAWINPFKRPNASWPATGSLRFHDYQTRYRPGLDLVLKGITCNIKGGEKVGIVGRTGAGKSSMTVALFRLIEAAAGSIAIDDIIIKDIGLHDLRSRITILPQDPVLFSGTLRMNVDPLYEYDDDAVWAVLEHAHLKEFALTAVAGLMYECGEGGQNLSVGQRQLVCLARSLLRKTKILVLDEATAAVDMETDDLIQKTIRSEFVDCTVLTIAHRLNTIMDYDRIMVLDKGEIKEMDSPASLLEDKNSIFYGMAKDANLV